jgi:hypothetical protein
MQDQITWPTGRFLKGEALGEAALHERRRDNTSDRDEKERRRDPMPFKGDNELDTNGSHPPLAWTLIWGGTYSNLYRYYIHPDVIRRWGYVMWDAARIEGTGAEELLARQWEDDWDDGDPRDDFW